VDLDYPIDFSGLNQRCRSTPVVERITVELAPRLTFTIVLPVESVGKHLERFPDASDVLTFWACIFC
jgi:hypothetical protein